MLRRVPQFLRPESNCRGQHRAAKEMSANGFGKVQTTPRAEVRAAPAQDVYGKSRVVEADVTDWASDDDVVPAESEEQRPLLRRQAVRTSAVTMRQKAAIRLDDVGKRNRLGALRALRLHATPRSSVRLCPGRQFVPTGREEPDTIGGTPFVCRALNGVRQRGAYHKWLDLGPRQAPASQ